MRSIETPVQAPERPGTHLQDHKCATNDDRECAEKVEAQEQLDSDDDALALQHGNDDIPLPGT